MGENGGFFREQSFLSPDAINNPSKPKPPSVFEQAGTLQSNAATAGADAEIAGLQAAIAQLQQILGGNSQFTQAGIQGLQGVQKGSTAGGFGERLASIIGGEGFGALRDERQRAVQGQLGAGQLTRSGTALEAAAAVPTELAFEIENQLFGRQAGLADMGFQSQGRDSGIMAQIAQLLGGQGRVRGEGIRGSAEAEAGGILGEEGFRLNQQQQEDQNQNDFFSTIGGIGGTLFGGPVGGSIGSAIGGLFSDPRLKTNVQIKGKIGPLDLVTWDWIEEAKDTIVANYRTFGFMSNQVKEHYPDLVSEYGGYDVVNYKGLMERLDG